MKENINNSNTTTTKEGDEIHQNKSENLFNQNNIYPPINESTIQVIEEDQTTLNSFS